MGRFRAADGIAAVERHRQNAGDGRLADTAVAAEDVAVGDTVLFESVAQSAGDMLLASNIGEALRTVFAGENLVSHRED